MRGRSSSTSSSSSSCSFSSSSSSSESSDRRQYHKHHHNKEAKRARKMRGPHFKHLMACRGMGPFPFGPGHHFHGPSPARMMHHHHLPPHFGGRNIFHDAPRPGNLFENMQSQMEILRINMNNSGHHAGKRMKHFHKSMGRMRRNCGQYFPPTDWDQKTYFNKNHKKEVNYLVKLEKKAKKLQKKMDKLEEKRRSHLLLLGLHLDMQEEEARGNLEGSTQHEVNVPSEQIPQREDIATPVEVN